MSEMRFLRRLKAKQAFGLVEIIIAVGVVLLLTALSLHGLLQAKAHANNGSATRNVKSIAAAMESYIFENSACTKDFSDLITAIPPYLSKVFSDGNHQGFDYWVIPDPEGSENYFVYAQPEYYKITGTKFVVWDRAGLKTFDDYTPAGRYVLGSELAEFFPSAPPGWTLAKGDVMLEGTCDSGLCPPGNSEEARKAAAEEGIIKTVLRILCKSYLNLI